MHLWVSNVKIRFIRVSKSNFLFVPFGFNDMNQTDNFIGRQIYLDILKSFLKLLRCQRIVSKKHQGGSCKGGQLVLSEELEIGQFDINLDIYVLSIKEHCIETINFVLLILIVMGNGNEANLMLEFTCPLCVTEFSHNSVTSRNPFRSHMSALVVPLVPNWQAFSSHG